MSGALRERMIPAPSVPPVVASRPVLARSRAATARAALAECRFCAYDCGINRLAGARGPCRAGPDCRVFSAQLEAGDELELIPTFAIAFSGCDLRCDFCLTGAESWNPRAGESLSTEGLGRKARAALGNGVRTVMFLGGEPTIHLPAALDLAAALPADAKLVWKTNAHGSAQARELLDGIFDVWLADYKFGNDACAVRLARCRDYTRVVRENLLWANDHSELIVRHLLMPGHLECCWRPVAEWLAAELPCVKVSLRAGFWPAWRSAAHPELLEVGRVVSTRRETPTRDRPRRVADNAPYPPARALSSGNSHPELRHAALSDDARRAFDLAADLRLNLVP